MCFSALPLVMSVVGTTLGVVGGIQQAKAANAAGRMQQQVAENNAKIATAQAQDASNIGAQNQEQSAWRTRAIIGSQKAAIASNNLDMDVGTPSDLMANTEMLGAVDRQRIALDASQKAWGFQAQATNYRNEGAQARWAGRAQANATILSTLGNAAFSVGSMGMKGMFGKLGGGGSAATMSGGLGASAANATYGGYA